MTEKPHLPVNAPESSLIRAAARFFQVVLAAAILLALLILLLPGPVFLAFSNYLQITVAITAGLALLYLWQRATGNAWLMYAAAAVLLWGVSNIAWYALVLLGQRGQVFPGIIDAGMIVSLLLIAYALLKGFEKRPVIAYLSPAIGAVSVIIPVYLILVAGISASSLVTLCYFIACGGLMVTAVDYAFTADRKIALGALLFALAFMIYPLREMLFVTNPALSIIGTFVSAGFALIALGMISVVPAS